MDNAELIEELESASEAPRWLSDKVLRALGWYMVCDPDGPEPYWKAPNGDACPDGYQPHVAANLQDAVDYVVPDGMRWYASGTDSCVGHAGVKGEWWESDKGSPALDLCIASLMARQADSEKEAGG